MSNPILTPTEYASLQTILQWAWTTNYQEPELCLKDTNYFNSDKHDCLMAGESGFNLQDDFEMIIDNPDDYHNILTMIGNLQYKLNAIPFSLEADLGNSWETLAPLVNNSESDRLWEESEDKDISIQSAEGYVMESVKKKDRIAFLQEHFDVDENGMIDMGDGTMLDGINSDLPDML